MNELSPDQFGDWLSLYYKHVLSQDHELINVQVFAKEQTPDIISAVHEALLNINAKPSNAFYLPAHNTHAKALQLFNSILAQNPNIGSDIPHSKNEVTILLSVNYDSQNDPVFLATRLGNI